MRRALAIGVSGFALAAGLGMSTSPVDAAAADCLQGNFCAWFNSAFGNPRYTSGAFNAAWAPHAVNNNDSSWRNNFNAVRNVRVLDGANLTICMMHPQLGQSQVGFNAGANDRGDNHNAPVSGC